MVEWYAGRYQAQLSVHLKKYGLRYDDLYDPMMDLVRHTYMRFVYIIPCFPLFSPSLSYSACQPGRRVCLLLLLKDAAAADASTGEDAATAGAPNAAGATCRRQEGKRSAAGCFGGGG